MVIFPPNPNYPARPDVQVYSSGDLRASIQSGASTSVNLALTQSFSRGLCFISTCTHEALKTTRSTESEEDRDCTASLMSDSPKRPSSSYEQDGPSNRPCSSAVPILAPPKLFEDTRSTRDDLWAGEYAKLPLSTEADDER